MAQKVTRLFEQFQPENYDLHLDIDREAMTFAGTVIIKGKKTGRPSQRLTFHQEDLKITSATVVKHDKKGDQAIEISRINNQNSFDEVRLHAVGMVYPGRYTVTMTFEGTISRSMNGIYPCSFKHDGQKKMLIATQFESHYARQAFPCIDEPEAKATFDLTLVTPAGETVIANTPAKTQKTAAQRLTTAFETTPQMSTYLLAFVFGELHGVKAKTKDGVEVRSWATVAQSKAHLQYANDEAVNVLEFLEDYFGTPFPLPKLDQVALPDFESLAMENWGLITYREVGLLADPLNRSLSGEQLITLVIAHEISHQWFGNLVTMKWWDDLWLNESFASIMENLVPDRLHPDWQQWESFAIGRILSCAQRDVYKDVQPVALAVKQPDEISSLFDPAIVYGKGSRLLSMLYDYIGEEAFRSGLKHYFRQHAYQNTTRHDLWQALGKSSHHDIEKLMTPWLTQSGTPKVTVKRQASKLQLTQQRFLLDGEDTESLWPIPLLANTELQRPVLDSRSSEQTLAVAETPILNVHGSSHFITDYRDVADRHNFQAKIVDRSVDSQTRINFLSDALLLNRLGDYPMADCLDLIRRCDQEPRSAVWSLLMLGVSQAQTLVDGDQKLESQLRSFRSNLAESWFNKLGWIDQKADDPNIVHLRTTALALSIAGENQVAVEQALKNFTAAGSVENLPAEQRAMVAGAAVRFGKPAVIGQLMKEYVTSPNPDVQESITIALCSTRDVKVAARIIKWGLGEAGIVRPQDIAHWFAYLLRNRYSRELAWQWLVDSWDRLIEHFGGSKYMEYFVWYSSGPLSTPDWQQRHREFFEPKLELPALKRNLQIAFAEIEARVAWRQREEKALRAYLAKLN